MGKNTIAAKKELCEQLLSQVKASEKEGINMDYLIAWGSVKTGFTHSLIKQMLFDLQAIGLIVIENDGILSASFIVKPK